MVGNVLTRAVAPAATSPLGLARALAMELSRQGHLIEMGDELPRPAKLPVGRSYRELQRLNGSLPESEEKQSYGSPLWKVLARHGGTIREGGRVELLHGPLLRPQLGDIARYGAGRVCPDCGSLMVVTRLYVRPASVSGEAGFLVLRSCLRSLPTAPGTAVECDYMEVM